jgi:hypothetical protein
VEKIGLTSTSFGINLSPDIVIMEKAPYGASFYVEKIGLTSTSFGIKLLPMVVKSLRSVLARYCNNGKSPIRGFFLRGEDRAYLNFVGHKLLPLVVKSLR